MHVGMLALPSSMTTIHPQIASGHEAASITDQEDSGATVLLGTRQTAQHVLLRPLLAALRVLDKEFLDHLGDNIAGADGVDADVVLTPLGGQVAAQLEYGGLGSVVGGADEALVKIVSLDAPSKENE